MFNSFKEAEEYIKTKQIRMIDLKFCDLWGKWHHVTISAKEFTPELMENGIGFDGSSVGFLSVQSGDMALVPDLTTAFIDIFWDIPTISFICNTVEADTKLLFRDEPREISRKAEKYLQETQIGDQSIWGPEFEFYIFNEVSFQNTINESRYSLNSDEGLWNSKDLGNGIVNSYHGGYHAIPPKDRYFSVRAKMADNLEKMGVPFKYHHHEVGGPGQQEIETPLLGNLKAGDACMMIKYITRMTAFQENLTITFLPKPLFGEAGNGMHFHQQIRKENTNIFYDSESENLLSETALFYIGGLLHHAPALLAFTNPSTNSYRRLVPGFEAPVNAFFSRGNRSAAIRIPKYVTNPDEVRFEFRPPDATCNPYLAMAAMLMAGIDGVMNKISPMENGFGPYDEDIFSWTQEERNKIKKLPSSLEESLKSLEKDHDFLVKNDVFSQNMIDLWISKKMCEFKEVQIRPHPYEIETYYDF